MHEIIKSCWQQLKAKKKHLFYSSILFGILGAMLYVGGVNAATWKFWAILLLVEIIRAVDSLNVC